MTQKITREATDRYADVSGVKIHYNEAGTGPTLICFHGGGPGANAWDFAKHNLDVLSSRFHMLLVDLPGYGYSDKSAKLDGALLDFYCAQLVRDLMDQLNIQQAHFYGSDVSGVTCLRFGIEYPDRTGKIVLQTSRGGGGGPFLFSARPSEGHRALEAFDRDPTRENMERLMRLYIPKDELCTEEMIESRFKVASLPGHLEARREFSVAKSSDVTLDLHRLKAEVLVVWGREDRVVPIEGAMVALARIPDVRVHMWGGDTGHFVG